MGHWPTNVAVHSCLAVGAHGETIGLAEEIAEVVLVPESAVGGDATDWKICCLQKAFDFVEAIGALVLQGREVAFRGCVFRA